MDEEDLSDLASDLRVSLGQINRRIRAELSFPLTQSMVLGRLYREGPQTISDLAAGARMRQQSMSQAVYELEAAGLVSRLQDPDDRRRRFVLLSEPGKAAIEQDRAHRDNWLIRILTGLTDEERATLAAAAPLLAKIAES
jgi:DNA-binding MarR family transcriptional regulator